MINPLGPSYRCFGTKTVKTAKYSQNRMYSRVCQSEFYTSIEILTDIKPDIANLREFGLTTFYNIPYHFRGRKLASRARKGLLVGYLGREKM